MNSTFFSIKCVFRVRYTLFDSKAIQILKNSVTRQFLKNYFNNILFRSFEGDVFLNWNIKKKWMSVHLKAFNFKTVCAIVMKISGYHKNRYNYLFKNHQNHFCDPKGPFNLFGAISN